MKGASSFFQKRTRPAYCSTTLWSQCMQACVLSAYCSTTPWSQCMQACVLSAYCSTTPWSQCMQACVLAAVAGSLPEPTCCCCCCCPAHPPHRAAARKLSVMPEWHGMMASRGSVWALASCSMHGSSMAVGDNWVSGRKWAAREGQQPSSGYFGGGMTKHLPILVPLSGSMTKHLHP